MMDVWKYCHYCDEEYEVPADEYRCPECRTYSLELVDDQDLDHDDEEGEAVLV